MGTMKIIIPAYRDYTQLAQAYRTYLLRLGYQSKSCRSRYQYACEFLHWLEQRGERDIREIDKRTLDAYYAHIRTRPNKTPYRGRDRLSDKTTHSHMRNVSALLEMLLQEGRLPHNPMSGVTLQAPGRSAERMVLTEQEIKALYASCTTARDRAILSLGYGCGLRVGELRRCNVEDIRMEEQIVIVPQGKGNKRRVIPMSAGVITDLRRYQREERPQLIAGQDYDPKDGAYMLNSRGGRMQPWTYNSRLQDLIERTQDPELGGKQITMHNLRHSIATHLLARGTGVDQVRQFLGHSQLETTQVYTHVSEGQLKELVE